MGEVYRARDTRLRRDVALKVLPAEFALDSERLARFQREAQAVAALNHPNVLTIYSVEEANGIHFLTMEWIDGMTRAELIPDGGMALPALLRIAIPLTDSISAAHQRGITDRDLKPANVMVTTDGRVKVLDFGLAKLTHNASDVDGADLTTVEQLTGPATRHRNARIHVPRASGGRPVDARSDVFSLGIVVLRRGCREPRRLPAERQWRDGNQPHG